jgi:hypothetical protein
VEAVGLIERAEACADGAWPWMAAIARWLLAVALVNQRRFAEGRARFDEAAVQARATGEISLQGAIRMSAGLGAMLQGDLAVATTALAEAADAFRATGGPARSTPLIGLGEIALHAGNASGAVEYLREALQIARAIGHRRNVADCLLDFGVLARMAGQPERAARLLGAAEALRGALNAQISVRQRPSHAETVQAMRAALGDAPFEHAWAAGRALTPEEAVADALEEGGGRGDGEGPGPPAYGQRSPLGCPSCDGT